MFAEREYEKFRIVQDREYKSDFDKTIDTVLKTGKLPDESETINITPATFDKTLKAVIFVPPPNKDKK